MCHLPSLATIGPEWYTLSRTLKSLTQPPNVRAQTIAPPPTKRLGLNSVVSVTLETGVRVWVALVKLEGNWGVPGFGGSLKVWVALIKLEGNCRVAGFLGFGGEF